MNYLPKELQVSVLHHLLEGCGVRSTNRLTNVARNTILSLLESVGYACREYQNQVFQNLRIENVQCDELWTFVYAKKKNATSEMKRSFQAGDSWTWVAADQDSRLIFSYLVGSTRDQDSSDAFMDDFQSRLKGKFNLYTDGNPSYLESINNGIMAKPRVNYGILQKTYTMQGGKRNPANLKIDKFKVVGHPKEKSISTSYVERINLTFRTNIRRFTRKTNGFSKKFENLEHAVALFVFYYNFVRPHSTLGKSVTPAMKAGIETRMWSIGDLVDLMNREVSEVGYSEVA